MYNVLGRCLLLPLWTRPKISTLSSGSLSVLPDQVCLSSCIWRTILVFLFILLTPLILCVVFLSIPCQCLPVAIFRSLDSIQTLLGVPKYCPLTVFYGNGFLAPFLPRTSLWCLPGNLGLTGRSVSFRLVSPVLTKFPCLQSTVPLMTTDKGSRNEIIGRPV